MHPLRNISADLVRAVQPLVPASLEVKDAEQQAAADAKDTNVIVNAIRYFLLGFGGIALFVGAFVIFNTLSITVAQRTREFATLRTLGASRKQVMRSVVIEGVVIGLLASVDRTVRRARHRQGLNGRSRSAETCPRRDGVRAADDDRLAARRHGDHGAGERRAGPARHAGAADCGGTRGLDAPALALRRPLAQDGRGADRGFRGRHLRRASSRAVSPRWPSSCCSSSGILGLFVGVAFAAPHMVEPLTRLVGWPARRSGGVAGELANANSVRNPSRTASTAAALMIGLTLVTVVAVLGAGMRHTVESAVTDQVNAPYILDGNDGGAVRGRRGRGARARARRPTASDVRFDKALVAGEEKAVTGVDPATIARFYNFDWTDGSDAAVAQLGADGALVTQTYADDQNLAIGDPLSIETASGDKLKVVVRGIYDPPEIDQMLGPVSIAQQAFDEAFPQPKNLFTFLDAGPDANQALTAASADFSDADVHTGAAFANDYTKGFASFLNFLYVLLAFSVVVSLFGMVNTLVLSGVRAHTRARDAADDRDDPPAGAPDDPPRERDHGADRRRPRAPARHLPRRRW